MIALRIYLLVDKAKRSPNRDVVSNMQRIAQSDQQDSASFYRTASAVCEVG